MLAIEIGEKRAAERLGINYDTVRQWSSRYGWKRPTASPQQPVTVVTQSPAQVLSDELAENERETRLSLSRYAKNAAKHSESATLRDSPYVHKAAQIAGIVHKWDAESKSAGFTLNVLNINSLTVDQDGL